MIGRPSLPAAAALCAALSLWTTRGAANDLVPSISLQTGFAFTRSPGNDPVDDYFVAATPALAYFIEGERTLLNLTYSFTGSLSAALPNAISNRLGAAMSYDVSPRTRLLFGAEALQALIGNYLLVRRAATTQLGGLPPLNTSLLTVGVNQGVSHEITPSLRLNQGFVASFVTSLDPDIQFRNYLAGPTVAIDRSWEFDAVGGELGLQYSRTFFPPPVDQIGRETYIATQIVTLSAGPTWDHDVTPNLSTSLNPAVQISFSPNPESKTRIGPAGRASALYSADGSGVGLDASAGIEPNVLLGTINEAQQITLRGFTPLSERYAVVLGVSAGYLHAKNIDLSTKPTFDNAFDAVLHDADITWTATEFLTFFLRYQFIGQTAGSGPRATPAIVRHGALLGIELFASRPTPRSRLPQAQFPKRVDRGDGVQQGRPGGLGGAPQR